MGLFDGMWAAGVMASVVIEHGYDMDDLTPAQQAIFKEMVLGLKDKNLSKKQAQETFNKLVNKYGSLSEALNFYIQTFGENQVDY